MASRTRRFAGFVRCLMLFLPVHLPDEDVESGGEEETEDGYPDHSAKYGGAQGLPHFRARATGNDQREDAQDERKGRHQDRAQTDACGQGCSFGGFLSLDVLTLLRELDD